MIEYRLSPAGAELAARVRDERVVPSARPALGT
jgi:hypothetical protein